MINDWLRVKSNRTIRNSKSKEAKKWTSTAALTENSIPKNKDILENIKKEKEENKNQKEERPPKKLTENDNEKITGKEIDLTPGTKTEERERKDQKEITTALEGTTGIEKIKGPLEGEKTCPARRGL